MVLETVHDEFCESSLQSLVNWLFVSFNNKVIMEFLESDGNISIYVKYYLNI